jgi:hypothetical protein
MSQSNDRPLCNTCHQRPVVPSLLKKYRVPWWHLCARCWNAVPFNKWAAASWSRTPRGKARHKRYKNKPESREHQKWLKRSQRTYKQLQETRF